MNNKYAIIGALAIVIVVVSVIGYIYVSSPTAGQQNNPTPTPTAQPTNVPTGTPTTSPTTTPTHAPTTSPTTQPTAQPTANPTPLPTLAPATLVGAGGTLVNPLMLQWIPAYNLQMSQIHVTYNAVGSGTGITNFQGQTVDFGESDAPMTAAQYSGLPSGTTALTIPISASAVVPAYNLKLANGSMCQNGLNFTGSVLANIFLGTINKWNDPAIKALQSSDVAAQLPDQTIITVHRSDGSGTMFAFTDYLSQASSQWSTQVGKGTSVNWPNPGGVAIANKGNGGVAASIAGNLYSLGPLEIAYEIQNPNQISYGAVQNGAGNYILANVSSVASALSAGASSLPAGDASWSSVSVVDSIFNDKTHTDIYPITTLTYALVYEQQTNQVQGSALVNFLSWVINSGQSLGPSLGYAPLPANIVALDNNTLKLVTYNGTPFLH